MSQVFILARRVLRRPPEAPSSDEAARQPMGVLEFAQLLRVRRAQAVEYRLVAEAVDHERAPAGEGSAGRHGRLNRPGPRGPGVPRPPGTSAPSGCPLPNAVSVPSPAPRAPHLSPAVRRRVFSLL